MMKAIRPYFAAIALLLGACGTSITYAPTATPPHSMAPRAAEDVQVFLSEKPSTPYVEIGLLEAQQESASLDDSPTVLAKLRARAGEIGCEGLIVLGPDDSVVGSTTHGTGGTATLKGYRAVCIVFANASAAAAPPAVSSASSPPAT